ncbi:hypothetical protein EYF80_066546 [Liparis tanakae]|uniref:Uncharacterized protein n=1 Tax=Liparis tanakae TaxID=230148 RepID=A0A4Z2E3I9_9TELE|nr:hypothetical protein EYF80_066546 [Liparis tanakae]
MNRRVTPACQQSHASIHAAASDHDEEELHEEELHEEELHEEELHEPMKKSPPTTCYSFSAQALTSS